MTTRRPDSRKQLLENVSASGFRSWTMDRSLTFNNNREWKFPQPQYLQAQGAIPEAVSGEHNKYKQAYFKFISNYIPALLIYKNDGYYCENISHNLV